MIATDLDRTMIYSAGAAEVPLSELVCVEYFGGEPLSYMTTRSAELLAALAADTALVPTTTRTIEQFQRIELSGAPWRYAITSNGGNILVDGDPDTAWRAQVDRRMSAAGASLTDVMTELSSRTDSSWVLKERTADDLFCYLVVVVDAVPPSFFDDWTVWCAERGWGVSQQGRKIYSMPHAVSKSAAVAEVRRRLVEDSVIRTDELLWAAGDGVLDSDMLMAADHAIRPRHGELHSIGWTTDGLTVTEASGARAGEEILRWLGDANRPEGNVD